jgi:hypothetical protein
MTSWSGCGAQGARAAARELFATRQEYAGTAEMRERTQVTVYYQTAAWDASVALRSVAGWEQQGWFQEGGRALVIVCDSAGRLAGMALDVVGARSETTPDWLAFSRAAWPVPGRGGRGDRAPRQRAGQPRQPPSHSTRCVCRSARPGWRRQRDGWRGYARRLLWPTWPAWWSRRRMGGLCCDSREPVRRPARWRQAHRWERSARMVSWRGWRRGRTTAARPRR